MNRSAQLASVLVLGVCLVAGTATATNVEITIWDGSGSTDGQIHVNETWAPASSDPWEDNEVEPGCYIGQGWDLEGMFVDADNDTLTLSGGFDFINGMSGYTSGDIFIAAGETPLYGAAAAAVPDADRTYADAYKYDYIMDIDWDADGGPAFEVYRVNTKDTGEARTTVVSYVNNYESNPWTLHYDGHEVEGASGTGTYTDFDGGDVNSVTFDVSWLDGLAGVYADDDLYFHFTEECGNDNLMGRTTGDFVTNDLVPVPEPASVGLLGMGLLGLMATRIRRKRF